ncbi:PD-(D/E)XK nuclease family protein [Bradyrhizobium sp. UFLA05-153]
MAFLLRPHESHGLGDTFLKSLLRRALENVPEPPMATLNLVLADFTDALVTREWRGIDVLIESKINRLVWAIENKIDSTESEDQLTFFKKASCFTCCGFS